VTAHVVAEYLHGRPIYEVLLERALRLAWPPAARAVGDSFFAGRHRRANNAARPLDPDANRRDPD